jgi:sigma-B regulation protein RsbU (phosphoserine phosphatase)
MSLGSRIAIIVSLAFALAFGSLVIIGLQREALVARPHTRIAIAGQAALWKEILEQQTDRLFEIQRSVAADPAFSAAVSAADLPALRRVGTLLTQGWLTSGEISDLQILDAQGRILYASSALAEPVPLIDISTIGAILGGAAPAGLRQTASVQFRAVTASRYETWNGSRTVLAVGSDAKRPLETFARAMDAQAYLIGTRGRMVEGTDPALWRDLDILLPQRVGTVRQAPLDDRLFAVTAIPVADLSAGSAGLLVAVQDATDALSALGRLTTLTVSLMAAIALLTVGGLYLYLRHSLAPLGRAVGILGAFSRGDTSLSLPERGNDEIGQIGTAIAKLRRSLSVVDEARRQRELQRRRQERFVRKQMETLAATLEPGARDEVLSDLGRIVAATRGGADASEDTMSRLIREDDQLGPIAAVLQQMSARVVEQHRRLSELVARLREALVRETRLASLQQELAIARDLQHSVLPADMAFRPTYAVKGVMESAQEVGGDFYDFFERRDGKLVFVIADVSGKGVPAAFFMAIARTLLKAIALFEDDPSACIRQLNDLLVVDNERMMFVTLIFGIFDPATGRVDFVNAGHLPPVRFGRASPAAFVRTEIDMAAAVAEAMDYSTRSIELAPGESLVLYTDGVTEAFNAAGDQFGDERLLSCLDAATGKEPNAVAEAVLSVVKSFEEGVDQSDDITLLVVQRAAATSAPD